LLRSRFQGFCQLYAKAVVDELTYGVVVPPMTRMPRAWARHDLAVRERPGGGSRPGGVAPDA